MFCMNPAESCWTEVGMWVEAIQTEVKLYAEDPVWSALFTIKQMLANFRNGNLPVKYSHKVDYYSGVLNRNIVLLYICEYLEDITKQDHGYCKYYNFETLGCIHVFECMM